MRRRIAAALVVAAALGPAPLAQNPAPAPGPALPGLPGAPVKTATLAVGDRAPGFTLTDQDGKAVRLEDFRGKKNVVLAFFPKAFTGG